METLLEKKALENDNSPVVLIDDLEQDILGFISIFKKRKVPHKVFDPNEDLLPKQFLSGVKLIFLDLIFSPGASFDVTFPVSWVNSIIPQNYPYQLIIWSKDHDRIKEVLNKLKQHNRFPTNGYQEFLKQDFLNNGIYDSQRVIEKASQTINGFTSELFHKIDSGTALEKKSKLDEIPALSEKEYTDLTLEERRLWRTYIEIKEINKEKSTIKILIPSWNESELIEVSGNDFSNVPNIKVDDYFFAQINKECKEKNKLVIKDIETPEVLEDNYAKLIHT